MEMFFSISGFWTMTIVMCLYSMLLYVLTKSRKIYKYISPNVVVLAVCLIALRCMLPIEIEHTWEVSIPAFVSVDKFLLYPIVKTDKLEIPIWVILLQIWFSVAFILIGRLVIEYKQTRRKLKSYDDVGDTYMGIIEQVEQEMGICRKIIYKTFDNANIDSPFIFGVLNPIIVLPMYTFDFSEDTLIMILKHELNHYRKRDGIIKMLLNIFYLFFWWLPFRKKLVNRLEEATEMRTDLNVIRGMTEDEKTQYLVALYNVAEKIRQKEKRGKNKFISGYAGLFEARFQFILHNYERRKTYLSMCVCLFLFIGSYSFVIEPLYEPEDGALSCEESCTIVPIENDKYEVYFDDEYLGIVSDISFLKSEDFKDKQIVFTEKIKNEKKDY